MNGYQDLEVFKRSMAQLKPVHELVLTFPDYEKFDLANQIRRASKSIPANIAEGYARRRSAKEFINFLTMAMGSANETELHLRIALELDYISKDRFQQFSAEYHEIGAMLHGLIRYWRSVAARASTSD